MEISILAIKILLILFPGIVATKISNRLTERRRENAWEFFVRTFLYGIVTYMCTYIIMLIGNGVIRGILYGFLNLENPPFLIDLSFYKNILNINEQINIDYINIVTTTVVAIILSFISSKCDNKGVLNKFAQKINVTKKFAEHDVWANLFNNMEQNAWITIRDIENDIIYQGWPRKFSSDHEEKELLLEDVIVFRNSDGVKLFERKNMYFNIKKEENFIMEIESNEEEE